MVISFAGAAERAGDGARFWVMAQRSLSERFLDIGVPATVVGRKGASVMRRIPSFVAVPSTFVDVLGQAPASTLG